MFGKWDYLKHFHPGERWGNPDKMDAFLLIIMDKMREYIGYPFIIHCGYATSGHVKDSQHYLGNAADFHIKASDLSYRKQISKVLFWLRHHYVFTLHGRIPLSHYVGLGIYPQAKVPYFHLDVRGYRSRWSFLDGKYVSWKEGMKYVRKHEI